MAREGKKRLTMDLETSVHFRLKELSDLYNLTITDLVTVMIKGFIESQEPYEEKNNM